MAAAAVPAISLGAQYFMNRGSNKKTSAAIDTATTGLQSSATDLSKFGGNLSDKAGGFLGDAQKQFGRANTSLDQSANYFSPLLRGGRGAIDASLAPERASITETYRGAGKALENSGMRGGTRDLASAELNRDRAGKLSLLTPAARANAATSMAQLGGQQGQLAVGQAGAGSALSGQSVNARAAGASTYAALFQGANRQREVASANNRETSGAIGNMIWDALKSRKPKAAGAGAPAGGSPGATGGPTAPTYSGTGTVPGGRPSVGTTESYWVGGSGGDPSTWWDPYKPGAVMNPP